jgi:hypothetical protein
MTFWNKNFGVRIWRQCLNNIPCHSYNALYEHFPTIYRIPEQRKIKNFPIPIELDVPKCHNIAFLNRFSKVDGISVKNNNIIPI